MALKSLQRSIGWALLGLAISMTGCASFRGHSGDTSAEDGGEIDGPSCTLIYRDKRDEVRAAKVPLDGMVTVGTVLDECGILRQRRRSRVIIYRKTDRPDPVRLEIELDGRQVKEEFNYALFPEDQIVVAPDDRSPLDALMNGLGPLAR